MMKNTKSLKNVMKANAIFTLVCSLGLFSFAGILNPFFGLTHNWILQSLAVALLIYAADLMWTASRKDPGTFKVLYFILMDLGWVIGSVIVITLFYSQLSLYAIMVIDLIAFMVAIFGFLQYLGFRKLNSRISESR